MKFEVYTKDGCPHCVSAKNLLKMKGYKYDEHVVGAGATKEDIQARMVDCGTNIAFRTVPQIFFVSDEGRCQYVGGNDSLQSKIDTFPKP